MNPESRPGFFSLLAQSLIVGGFIIGCAVVDGSERVYLRLPEHKGAIEVLSEPPTKPYEVVADVQWEGGSVKQMIDRAKKLGGDAVIIKLLGGSIILPTTQTLSADSAAQGKTFHRMVGTIIKYN